MDIKIFNWDEISLECNDEGKLYGSVNPKLVSDELAKMGHEIPAEMISIEDIKSTGEFNITVNIYEEITSQLKILISKK